jgi:Tol biopolymer transport system component
LSGRAGVSADRFFLAGLRWSPDGTMLSLIAIVGEKPQVFAVPISGTEPRQLTDAAEGVTGFEWSLDGTNIAYLSIVRISAGINMRVMCMQKSSPYEGIVTSVLSVPLW